MNRVSRIEQGIKRNKLPSFRVGDTVRVSVKVKEGEKERIQVFEGNVIARQFQFMHLGTAPVNLYLRPIPNDVHSSPAYLGPDGEWVQLGVSSGSYDLPVAQINGDCTVVPTTSATFSRRGSATGEVSLR